MKIRSGGNQHIYDTKTLSKPSREIKKLIKEESAKVPTPHKVKFYIVNETPEPFAGCAFIGDDSTYSVCLSGRFGQTNLNNLNKDYLKWVIRHELRHCVPTDGKPFRYHDKYLYDIGFKDPLPIGFFQEDFEDIGADDNLKLAFRNIYRLDEFLPT
jgi:hypothetical protein